MKKLYWGFGAVFGVGLFFAGIPASAQPNTPCTGTLAAGTYNNVSVPSNQSCTIGSGVTVNGNVTVAAGASLNMNHTTVHGSIVSNGASSVILGLNTIVKNVTLAGTEAVQIAQQVIDGNLLVTGSVGTGGILIGDNVVTGNVTLSMNSGGTYVVYTNTVGGNLVCSGNTPPPTNAGDPNAVSGHEVDQCSGL
jgi:hexosaminidase